MTNIKVGNQDRDIQDRDTQDSEFPVTVNITRDQYLKLLEAANDSEDKDRTFYDVLRNAIDVYIDEFL